MVNQPVWELVAQLGDVNPLEHGGKWLFVDTTGVYDPELELLYPPSPLEINANYLVYRMVLNKCFYTDGVLSDNRFHLDFPAWFADSLASNSLSVGSSTVDIIGQLLSDRPVARALGYISILEFHGPLNFDNYPLELTREKVESRYSDSKYHLFSSLSASINDE